MRMVTIPKRWTAEEVRALPEDGRRYELIDGILIVNGVELPSGDLADATPEVTPSPSWRHQDVVGALHVVLRAYVRDHAIGHLLMAPADTAPLAGTVAQPDLFVVPLVGGRPPKDWDEAGRLILAVEVLSPSSTRTDRVRKRHLYQRVGVPEYWIVDPNAQLVERWRPDDDRPELLDETLVWHPDPEMPALSIDLAELFADAMGAGG